MHHAAVSCLGWLMDDMWGMYITCRGLPWHHLRQNLPRHLPRHTTEPSTDLHGMPWNPNPNAGCHDSPWGYHGIPWRLPRGLPWYHPWHATAPPTACHEILCHTMGCRGDAMVCHGCYHGHATQSSNSVEPCEMSTLASSGTTECIMSCFMVYHGIYHGSPRRWRGVYHGIHHGPVGWIMVYSVVHGFSMGCTTEHTMYVVNYGWVHCFSVVCLSFSFSFLVVAQIRSHILREDSPPSSPLGGLSCLAFLSRETSFSPSLPRRVSPNYSYLVQTDVKCAICSSTTVLVP